MRRNFYSMCPTSKRIQDKCLQKQVIYHCPRLATISITVVTFQESDLSQFPLVSCDQLCLHTSRLGDIFRKTPHRSSHLNLEDPAHVMHSSKNYLSSTSPYFYYSRKLWFEAKLSHLHVATIHAFLSTMQSTRKCAVSWNQCHTLNWIMRMGMRTMANFQERKSWRATFAPVQIQI